MRRLFVAKLIAFTCFTANAQAAKRSDAPRCGFIEGLFQSTKKKCRASVERKKVSSKSKRKAKATIQRKNTKFIAAKSKRSNQLKKEPAARAKRIAKAKKQREKEIALHTAKKPRMMQERKLAKAMPKPVLKPKLKPGMLLAQSDDGPVQKNMVRQVQGSELVAALQKQEKRKKTLALEGCFEVTYTEAQLKKNADQLTGALKVNVNVGAQPESRPDAWGSVLFRHKSSKTTRRALKFECYDNVTGFACASECDGGVFSMVPGPKGLSLVPMTNLRFNVSTGECESKSVRVAKDDVKPGFVLALKDKKACTVSTAVAQK